MDYMKTLASLSLGSRLKRLSDQLFAEVTVIYDGVGLKLNPSYFLLLNLINEKGAMGITQAAETLSISHPAVSKLANKMIKEGYLVKHPHLTDKRASNLSLTSYSIDIIKKAAPTWRAIQQQLDYIESLQTTPLLKAIDQFEHSLSHHRLAENVLQKLEKPVSKIEIVNWNSAYKNDFKRLNMSWLNSQFNGELTESDKQALNHPESYYLAKGGYLYFAKQNNKVVGCIAFLPIGKNDFELSKMAVATEAQGQGVGRKLLISVLDKVRELLTEKISLETNSKLLRAIQLYKHVGFVEKEHPNGKSEYKRADTYMELHLNG